MPFDPTTAEEEPSGFDPRTAALDEDPAQRPLPRGVTASDAGAGRGGQGGPTAEELRLNRARRGTTRGVAPYVPSEEYRPTVQEVLEQPQEGFLDTDPRSPERRAADTQRWVDDGRRENFFARSGELRPIEERGLLQRALDSTTRKPLDNSLAGLLLESVGDAGRGVVRASQGLGGSAWSGIEAAAEAVGAGDSDIAGIAGAAGTAARGARTRFGNVADPSSLTQQVFESTFTSLPIMLAAPGAPLTALMGHAAANEYGESRDRGLDHNAAAERGVVMGLAEGIGERFGLPQLQLLMSRAAAKASAPELGRILGDMLVREQVGEQVTSALQAGYEKAGRYGARPDMTLQDYIDDAVQTAKVTLGQSLLTGGLAAGVKKIAREPSAGDRLGRAMQADLQERDFSQGAIDGYAARASDPKFYDPTFVDPRNTAATPGRAAVTQAPVQVEASQPESPSILDAMGVTRVQAIPAPQAVVPMPQARVEGADDFGALAGEITDLERVAGVGQMEDQDVGAGDATAVVAADGGGRVGADVARGMASAGPAPAVGPGVGAGAAGALAGDAAAVPVRERDGDAAVDQVWTGRNADGYEDEARARQVLNGRAGPRARYPGLTWNAERLPTGRWQLVGRRAAVAALPTQATNNPETTDEQAAAAPAPVVRNGVDRTREPDDPRAAAPIADAAQPDDTLGRAAAEYDRQRSVIAASVDRYRAEVDRLTAEGQAEQAGALQKRAQDLEAQAASLPVLTRPPRNEAFERMADAIEGLTGHRPVAYVDTRPEASDGFTDLETVYVNLHNPQRSVAFTAFHELQHIVRAKAATDPAAEKATRMLDQVWGMIDNGAKQQYATRYLFRQQIKGGSMTVEQALADPLLRNEMLSDFMGKRADDEDFWRTLARKDPANFGSFVTRWIDSLRRMIAALRGSAQPGTVKDIDRAIVDLERAKLVAEKVMRSWAAMNPKAAREAQVLPDEDAIDERLAPNSAAAARAPAAEGTSAPSGDSRRGELVSFRSPAGKTVRGRIESTDGRTATILLGEAPLDAGPRFRAGAKVPLTRLRRIGFDVDSMAPPETRSSRREFDEMGAFNVDRALDDSDVDMETIVADDKFDEPELTPEQEAALRDELAFLQTVVPEPELRRMEAPSDEVLASVGIMAESAYQPLKYDVTASDRETARITFTGASRYTFEVVRRLDGRYNANPEITPGPGAAVGLGNVSESMAQAFNQRVAASIDLTRRGFDLFTAIPAAARKRVLEAWQRIASLPGAFEFGASTAVKGQPPVESLQRIADELLDGTRYKAEASVSRIGWYTLQLTDTRTGATGEADIEYIGGIDKKLVMHTQDFERGSALGKPFYQVAFAWGHELGIVTNADRNGLLGVNNYRRTEQMMSAAARAGRAGAVNPGTGQRIYGWNARAKDAAQQDRNMVRIALAAARNAAELVPAVRDLQYDLANDRFTWRRGKGKGDAEAFVSQALADGDVRAVSISRSTLARAAVTFEAMDGKLNLDVDRIATPVLYSARGPLLDGVDDQPASDGRDTAVVDEKLLRWARGVWGGEPGKIKNAVLADRAPHPALLMGDRPENSLGREQPLVLPDHVVVHMRKRHADDGLTPDDIARIPDGLARPRAVVFKRDGASVILPATTDGGAPLLVHLAKDRITGGGVSAPVKVSRIQTLYSLDNSLRWLAGEMKDGSRVWLPSNELQRVGDLLTASVGQNPAPAEPGLSNASRTSQPRRAERFQRPTAARNVLSDAALVKFEAGDKSWVSTTEKVDVPDVRELTGIQFNARDNIWDTPEPTLTDKVIFELQNKNVDLKRVTAAVTDAVGQLSDRQDAYLREELFHGRVADRTKTFLEKEIKPLMAALRAAGIDLADFETFLHARHARERNAAMRAMNLEREDNEALSGMTDAEAARIVGEATPVMRQLAERVDAIVAGTRDLMEVSGLETRETVDALRAAYDYYVPLHRDELHPEARELIGTGFHIKGSNIKRATGSTARVTNILAHLVQQREATIVRAEKNLVAMALYSMALRAPNSSFWRTDDPPKINRIDDRDGQVYRVTDPMYKNRENVLVIKVNGNDRSLVFDERNERAMRMARSLKNLDIDALDPVSGVVAVGTRWFASVNTQYNPVFAIVNGIRDIQSALVNLASTPLRGKQVQVASDALMHGYSAVWRAERDETADDQWVQLYRELSARGGLTGWRDNFTSIGDRARALVKEIDRAGEGAAMRGLRAGLGVVSDLNTAIENGTRLAVYKAGLDAGLSKDRAASISKNVTVNFNRKGRAGRMLGAWYAFFNAAVQGTTRMAEVLASPAGRKVIIGGVAMGVLQAAMLSGLDEEDEENLQEWEKEKNWIIPIRDSDGKFIKIPMPLGLHVLPNIGRHLGEMAFAARDGKRVEAARHVTQLLGSLLDAFNPIGGSNDLVQAITPTVIDPLVQLSQNKDFSGKPIYRERSEYTGFKSGDSLGRDSTSPVYRWLAAALNRVTGGEEGVRNIDLPAAASPQPEALRFIVESLGGGVWRESEKLIEAMISAAKPGAENDPWRLPLIGRFYGDLSGPQAPITKFYENMAKVEAARAAAKRLAASDDDTALERLERRKPELAMADRAGEVRRQVAKLRDQRREAAIEGAAEPELREIDVEIGELMRDFNREMRERLAEQN